MGPAGPAASPLRRLPETSLYAKHPLAKTTVKSVDTNAARIMRATPLNWSAGRRTAY